MPFLEGALLFVLGIPFLIYVAMGYNSSSFRRECVIS